MSAVRASLIGVVAGLLAASAAFAQVPQLIRYQGTLVDPNNVPVEGTYNLTFRLYDAATGGTALWTETQTAIPISRGVFNVLLGQATPLNMTFDADYWLSTQVGTDAEMAPRQRLTSVPYAYRAETADHVQDQPPGFEVDTGGTLTDGLIAYWKLEEAGGARDDQKGPHDLADVNTVTQAGGKKSQAAKFTRANAEYLSIADNADLSTGDIDFTIAAWVYLDSAADDSVLGVLAKDDSTTNREYHLALLKVSGTNSFVRFRVFANASTSGFVNSSVNPLATGTWYLLVAWHDSVNNTVNIQINNGTVDSTSYSSGGNDSITRFDIGLSHQDGSSFWNGRIDETGFWKRVLTAQERADLYNSGAGNTYVLGKAATPWTQADAGIAYTEGRLGIGTLSIPNILSVQQGSPTDPIADSWTVYPSDRQHKDILRTLTPHGYLAQLKATELYEWTRTPRVSDDEAKQALRSRQPAPEALDAKKRDLAERKAQLPKFTTKRLGVAIDDDNVPSEILTFNEDGTKTGIDLLAYLGYLHAALKEAAVKIEDLESRSPPRKQP